MERPSVSARRRGRAKFTVGSIVAVIGAGSQAAIAEAQDLAVAPPQPQPAVSVETPPPAPDVSVEQAPPAPPVEVVPAAPPPEQAAPPPDPQPAAPPPEQAAPPPDPQPAVPPPDQLQVAPPAPQLELEVTSPQGPAPAPDPNTLAVEPQQQQPELRVESPPPAPEVAVAPAAKTAPVEVKPASGTQRQATAEDLQPAARTDSVQNQGAKDQLQPAPDAADVQPQAPAEIVQPASDDEPLTSGTSAPAPVVETAGSASRITQALKVADQINDGREGAGQGTRKVAGDAGRQLRTSEDAAERSRAGKGLRKAGEAAKKVKDVGKPVPGLGFGIDFAGGLSEGADVSDAAGGATASGIGGAIGAAGGGLLCTPLEALSFGLATPACVVTIAGGSILGDRAGEWVYDRVSPHGERRKKPSHSEAPPRVLFVPLSGFSGPPS